MPRVPTTLLVVPCFNEAKRLDVAAFERFASAHADVGFLFVDDGSSDATGEVLAGMASRRPLQFRWIRLAANGGKAEAVRQGVLTGIGLGPDFIGYWDADLATPLDELPAFCAALQRDPAMELVVGTRLPLSGHRIERSRFRSLLGSAFAQVAGRVLGLRLVDTQCGAKLFRITPRTAELFVPPFGSRWIFDVELLARMKRALGRADRQGLWRRVYEQPLVNWREVGGSRLKLRDYVRAVFELSAIWWRQFRPVSSVPRSSPMAPVPSTAGVADAIAAPPDERQAA